MKNKNQIFVLTVLLIMMFSIANAKLVNDFVDRFEDGNISSEPVWDIASGADSVSVAVPPKVSSDKPGIVRNAGKYSLVIKGNGGSDKQVAFLSAVTSISDNGYTHLRIMSFNGVGSKGEYTIVVNEKYTYSVYFSWVGWRQAVIPLNRLKDSNGTSFVGQIDSFGIKIDSADENGNVNLGFDNIELLRVESF